MGDINDFIIDDIHTAYTSLAEGKNTKGCADDLVERLRVRMRSGCGMICIIEEFNDSTDKIKMTPIGMTNTGWTKELFSHVSDDDFSFTFNKKSTNMFIQTIISPTTIFFNNVPSYYSKHKDHRPNDHPTLTSFIGRSFMVGKVKAYINFGNKDVGDYDQHDVDIIENIIVYLISLIQMFIDKRHKKLQHKGIVPEIINEAMISANKEILIIDKFDTVFHVSGDVNKILNTKISVGDKISDASPGIYSHIQNDFVSNNMLTVFNGNVESYVPINIIPIIVHKNKYRVVLFCEKNDRDKVQQQLDMNKKYISYINHEIRNPLQTITMALNVLQLKIPEAGDYVSRMKKSIMTINTIIDGIHEVNKLMNDKITISYDIFNLIDIINSINLLHSVIHNKNNINFTTHFDDNIPNTLKGDKQKISRIYEETTSLLSKTFPGSKIIVKISYDDHIIVQINIKPYKPTAVTLKTLMDPYHKNKSHNVENTYFVMTIVQKTLDILGGDISIDDNDHDNMIMNINIPADIFDTTLIGINSQIENLVRVLIVDDDHDQCYLLKELISSFSDNIMIDIASDGQEAIYLSKNEKYDLVLMDINMIGINGIETSRMLKKIDNEIQIIAITGNTSLSDSYSIGDNRLFDKVINKPISLIDIDDIMKKLID